MSQHVERAWEEWVDGRNPQALNEVVRQYAGMVYGTCLRVLRNEADAEEVAQDCFEALVRERDPGQVRVPGAWLHGTAVYRSVSRLRSDARRNARELRYGQEQAASVEAQPNDLSSHVDVALAELPEELRAPIVQHFLLGRSQREVAGALGIPRRTVRRRMEQGLDLLGESLRKRGVAGAGAAALGVFLTEAAHASAAPPSLIASLGRTSLAQSAGRQAAGIAARHVGMSAARWAVGLVALAAVAAAGIGVAVKEQSSEPGEPAPRPAPVSAQAEGKPPSSTVTETGREEAAGDAMPEAVSEAEPGKASVSGYVVDEDGRAVTDVCIGMNRGGSYGRGAKGAVPVDEEGKFEHTALEPGKYSFFFCSKTVTDFIETEHFEDIPAVVTEPLNLEEGQAMADVCVVVPAAWRSISGRVLDAEGEPIAGVHLKMHNGITNGETVSDAGGRFILSHIRPNYFPLTVEALRELPEKYYLLRATHDAYEAVHSVEAVLGQTGVEITMHARCRGAIRGRVVNAETGELLFGAKVWPSRVETPYGETIYAGCEETAQLSLTGAFSFDEVACGEAMLCALLPGYGKVFTEPVTVSAGEPVEDFVIAMERAGRVLVPDLTDGLPEENRGEVSYVKAYGANEGEDWSMWEGEPSNGFYELELPPGAHEVVLCVAVAWDLERRHSGLLLFSAEADVVGGESKALDVGGLGTGMVEGVISTPNDDQTCVVALRRGSHEAPLPEKYARTRPWRMGGWMGELPHDGIFAFTEQRFRAETGPAYSVGFLPAGTYTLTAIVYDDATGVIEQQSRTFSVADEEVVTLDLAF